MRGVARHDFAMLGRDLIRQRNGISDAGSPESARRCRCNTRLINSRRASLGNCLAISFSTALRIFAEVVTSQTRSWPEPCSACASMSAAANFGFAVSSARTSTSLGPAQQVNRHVPDEQPLGHADVGVAGAENFLHAANRLGAVSHRRNRLRAADAINLRRPRRARGKQNARIDGAVLAARRGDDDFLAARDFRQRDGHQRRGNQRRGAAGNVNADALERIKFFADARAVGIFRLPVFAQLIFWRSRRCFLPLPPLAARSGSSALMDAASNSAAVTANWSADSFAPSNFSMAEKFDGAKLSAEQLCRDAGRIARRLNQSR